MGIKVQYENIRLLAFGDISGTYAAVGTVLSHPARNVKFVNTTQGDMYFTMNNAVDQIIVPAGTAYVADYGSNKSDNDTQYVIAKGTQFYVKQIEAPVSGAVYIEVYY